MAFQISKEKVEQLDVKGCFFEGLDIFKANPIQIFIAFIFLLVGAVLTLGILAGALYAGFIDYILKLKNKDESAKPTDVFGKLNVLVPCLLVMLASLAIGIANNIIIGGLLGPFISFLTSILASSVVCAFMTLSLPLLANGKIEGAPEALQTGWDTFLLSPKTFFILSVAGHVLGLIGVLCLGIGTLITAPLTGCMMAVAFDRMTKETQVI